MKKRNMRIGFVVNRAKPLAARLVPELVEWIKAEGHTPCIASSTARALGIRGDAGPASALVRKADLVVALGGDGTMLRAARLVGKREVPIMGVNLGGLGFLTEFAADEAREGISAFLRGTHVEERRMLLACSYRGKRGFALNDIAVNMGKANRVIDITARSGGVFITRFVGDGVVIATPTGSTAYSLAAGGPVVYPTMQAILLTPLSPHALGSRPLILSGDTKLEFDISPRSGTAVVNLDGQERWEIEPEAPVRVSRADFTVRLVTPEGKTYYQILRDKLNWTGSQR